MEKQIPEIFQYERPEVPADCIHAISPSQIEKFFTYPKVWYEEMILGKEKSFIGSTASVTGTICHYIYEQITKGNQANLTREYINAQLDEYCAIMKNPDINPDQVKIDYPLVSNEVVNSYVLPHNQGTTVLKTEEMVVGKVMDGIYIAGTCDRIENDCIVDYKTVATKPNENQIPFGYKIQLLSYAYAFRQKGYEINRIRIVYGVKPTKTIGARCFVVTEVIDYIDEKFINNTLRLIAESVLAVKEKPELAYLIFKSMDLKEN